MSEQESLINQFREVTGADHQRAQFYLESAGWKIDAALAGFFENDNSMEQQIPEHSESDSEPAQPTVPIEQPSSRTRSAATKASGNIRTILNEHSSDSESDEDGQAFYVGGSERSGQQVLGPPRQKGKTTNDLVGDMFKSAKEHGAEVVEKTGGPMSKVPSVFKGTGYRLGQSDDDTQVIPGARAPEPPRSVTLRLWKNGFSLDDGPMRDYHNPANQEFLDHIKRGEIPMELIREHRGREVHLQMEDHRTEEFLSKKPRFQAFAGEGQVLGSPAPSVAVPSSSSANLADCEKKAASDLNLNNNEPVTNVQIRLADGSRLVGRFNHTHTISQLRQYIITARPQYATQSFVLMTTYPPQELKEDGATLKEASLLGATIMQRMK